MTVRKLKCAVLAVVASAVGVAFGDIISPVESAAENTAAIQAAIDAAGTGGTVELGEGTFEIDEQLMVTNGVTLVGQGWRETILKQTKEKRVVMVDGGAKLVGVMVTGGKYYNSWGTGSGVGVKIHDGTVSYCCISNNIATGYNIRGGGVELSKGTIDHSIVACNEASHSGLGGGIGCNSASGPVLIESCLVYGNSMPADGGGGIGFDGGSPDITIRNTTITGNSSANAGGGLKSGVNNLKLVNSIVSENTAGTGDANITGTLAAGSSNNLVDDDPMFIDAENGDYHLAKGSSAVGKGIGYDGMGEDLDGNAFVATPSIGCYELLTADPTFAPTVKRFYPSTEVTLTCATAGATIYYTTDGSDPTDASAVYAGPIALTETTTIKAFAVKDGLDASSVVEATYTNPGPPQPSRLGVFGSLVTFTVTRDVAGAADGMPVLVKLSEDNPSGFKYASCDPAQMRFGDAEFNALPFEVDTWNPNGESLVWVKVPLVKDTEINLVYDGMATVENDPAAVWGDYTGVWHLNDLAIEPDASLKRSQGVYPNSTAVSDIDGHLSIDSIPGETGRFGKSFLVNNWTTRQAKSGPGGVWVKDGGVNSPLDADGTFTISGWFMHQNWDYYWDHVFYKRTASGGSGAFAIENNNSGANNAFAIRGGSSTSFSVTLTSMKNCWAYLTFVYEGTKCTVYQNGKSVGSSDKIAKATDNDDPLVFGNNIAIATQETGDACWQGWIDEVRFAKGTKDAAFIAAEYAAMTADDLLAAGAVEPVDQTVINISSSIGPCGGVDPDYGVISSPVAGQEYVFRCTETTDIFAEDARRGVCTGWKLYDLASGELLRSSADAGEEPFVCKHTYVQGQGVKVEWQWRVEYKTKATVEPSQGSVEFSGEWFSEGDKVTATVTPAEGSAFLYWTGDGVTDANKTDNPLTLTVGTAPINLTPVFSSTVFVSPEGSDANGGKSWDDALATIPAALAKGPILTVYLAEGLYDVQTAAQVENQVTIIGSGERASVVRLAAVSADTSDRDKKQAVFYLNNADARLSNLAITTGGSARGRGVYVANGTVENCSITNCVTVNGSFNGGGIYMKSGTVRGCFINNNQATSSGGYNKQGGGIYMEGGLVENCAIVGNFVADGKKSGNASGSGAGVRMTGGTVRNCLVAGNFAQSSASGIHATGNSALVENCTVVGNSQVSSSLISGLIASDKVIVRNTIVRYNLNTSGEANVSKGANVTFDQVCTTTEAGTAGVVTGDPTFVDKDNGDWHIGYGACVDTGKDQDWMTGATDLDGTERIVGEHVDLGCYEFVASGLACGFDVMTDGALDESTVTLRGSVLGAAPADVTFTWTLVDGAGVQTVRSGKDLAEVELTMPIGAYSVTLAVTDGAHDAETSRSDAFKVFATDLYVSPTGANTLPYGSFATAATNLIDALTLATDGSTVHLSDGIHRVSAKIVLTKAVTLTHEGDREACIVTGNTGGSLVVLDNAGARLEGLDICGQYPRLVFDATIDQRPTSAYNTSHGVEIISGGTVENCVVESCRSAGEGPGVLMSAGTVIDTVIRGNYAYSSGGGGANGAGLFMQGGLVDRCVITNNLASYGSATWGGGASVKGGTLRNSFIAYNYGSNAGGVNRAGGTVQNCTIVRNVAITANGGVGGTVTDCLVYGNKANGVDVDTDDPGFVNAAAGDFHLDVASKAIDASVTEGIGDYDVERTGRYSGGVADKGCFEYDQSQVSIGVSYERLAAFAPCDVAFTASAGFKQLDASKCWWTFDGREPTEGDYDLAGIVVTNALNPGQYTVRFKTVLEGETYEVVKADWFMLTGENVYVNPQNATPQEPFASWETAAADINEGLKYLVAGATLVVSDGTYRVTAEQSLDRKVTVRSLNGPAKTILTGSRPFVLRNAEATISGFTFSGIYSFQQGGALQMSAGTVTNCAFEACSVGNNGGAAVYMLGGTVVDCVVSNCFVKNYNNDNYGSGIRATGASALIDRCVVRDCWYESEHYARGAVALFGGATLRNSIVSGNRSYEGGGVRVSGASRLENCTVFGNSSDKAGAAGGVDMTDADGLAVNTIVWQNTNTADGVIRETAGTDAQFDTCWMQDPLFLSRGKPCRLRTASPCRDAAKTLDWMNGAVDVYGDPRIRFQKPDIGATEGAFGFMLMVK